MGKILKSVAVVSLFVWALKVVTKKDAEKIAELEKKVAALESERRIHIKRTSAEREGPWVKAIK